MMLLPKKIGPFTLMRKLGSDGVTESYVGILDEPAGKQVVVRRVLPWITRDPQRLAEVEARVKDLVAVRHPVLVPVLDYVVVEEDRYLVEEWVDAVDLEQVVSWCRAGGSRLPANVYLNLATQICNGLEALHSRPGAASGAESVLHTALRPKTIFVTIEGKVLVGDYGLTRSPTAIPPGGLALPLTNRMEYLSPEQTHQDQKLAPPSDIFALGGILYELLTLQPMFRADSNLQTIHRVRRAEVTTQLLEVKELLPGLDKVLYRALSLNPRHRYQRAFVLREDLRGLMAGFSFANITDQTREFLLPLFASRGDGTDEILPQLGGGDGPVESTSALLDFAAEPSPHAMTPRNTPAPAAERVGPPGLGVSTADTAAHLRQARGAPAADPSPPRAPAAPSAGMTWDGERAPHAAEPSDSGAFDDEPATDVRDLEAQGSDTSWFPTGGVAQEAAARSAPSPQPAAEPPARSAAREPEVAKPKAPAPAPAPTAAPRAAASAPRPPSQPPRTPAPVQRFDEFEDEPPPRSSAPFVFAAVGLGAVAVFGLICVGVGGGMFFASGDDPGTVAAATGPGGDALAEAHEPAEPTNVADAAPTEPEGVTTATDAGAGQRLPPPSGSPSAPREPTATSAAPTPRPSAPAPSYAYEPAPRPAPAEDRYSSTARAPAPTETPEAYPTSRGGVGPLDFDPVADLGFAEPAVAPPPVLVEAGDLSAYSDRSYAGQLTDADRQALAAVDIADHDKFTRARSLLYLDAKARGDQSNRKAHLAAIMALPENQYRPEWLVEQAEIAIRDRDYARALERATLAERHWARLPSDLVFSRKMMIYEIEASSNTGLFYASQGENTERLVAAIRAWERYRQHVGSQQRQDLISRADTQLGKLQDIQRRLE